MNGPLHAQIDREFSMGNHVNALRLTEYGLFINPHDLNLYRAMARLYQVLGVSSKAEKWIRALINHSPPRYADLFDLSTILNEQSKYTEVITQLDQAELIKNDDPVLYLRRGGAHWEMRNWEKADADFKRVLKINPNHPEAVWVRGLLNLQLGRFTEGWPGYEARWRSQRFKSNRLITNKPQWSVNGGLKRVLVWGEQGVGDQIFYASALPHLRSLTDKVTMLVDPRLIPIFERSMPDISFVPNTSEIPADDHDSHLPVASLHAQFIRSIDDIPRFAARNYLRPPAGKIKSLRSRFPAGKPIIGLSWTSNAVKIGPHKSIPFELLEPLLSDRFTFVNLQYVQSTTEQVHKSVQRSPVDCRMDLDGLAALLMVCDVVISVSSSTVHLAAALGRPVLLMDANKLWYWGNRDENDMSYWYPSVKVFPRDHVMAPWNNVIDRVRDELSRRFP